MDATTDLNHKTGNYPAGVDVLFTDAHVNWQSIKGNNKKGSYEWFDQNLWTFPPPPTGEMAPDQYRIIFNAFQP